MSKDLINKLKAVHEEVEEETTSGDIAFAPGTVKEPSEEDKELLKDKSVQMNKRQKGLKEEFDARVPVLKKKIVMDIHGAIIGGRLNPDTFIKVFVRNSRDITGNKAIIKYQNIERDEDSVKRGLPEDVGELELIESAIEGRTSLKGFDPFDAFEFLFGARIIAREYATKMMYEGYMDMNFVQAETLYVDDIDIVSEAASKIGGVKASKKMLFPIGGTFVPDFFRQLKDLIITGGKKDDKTS